MLAYRMNMTSHGSMYENFHLQNTSRKLLICRTKNPVTITLIQRMIYPVQMIYCIGDVA